MVDTVFRCIYFQEVLVFVANPGVLVGTPLTNYRKAHEILKKHVNKEYHKNTVTALKSVMSGQQKAVSIQLSDIARNQVLIIEKKLSTIIDTIILCGRQNIPLRVHRESCSNVECSRSLSANKGNFFALLEFRELAGRYINPDNYTIHEDLVTIILYMKILSLSLSVMMVIQGRPY